MQPLARISPRLAIDSILSSATSRSLRFPSRPSIRATICLQCRIRSQARHFADDSKPPRSSPALSSTAENTSQEPPTKELPSAEESRRMALTKRFSNIMDNLQGNIFIASQRINDLTGYSGIEALKQRITALERHVADSQEAVRSARLTYKTTVADRASTQREVTTLLARKDSWTPTDLERFTSLYRNDHSNEQAVQEAATKLADAEREAEHAAAKLSSSILSRYHEEQIWSDKIRRMSTWGTWGLMGVNVLLFLVFQFGFEPWRRRRLVHGFEEKVREALELEKIKEAERRDTSRGENDKDVPLDGIVAASIQELEEEIGGDERAPEPAVQAVIAAMKGNVEQQEENADLDAAELHVPRVQLQLNKPETWKAAARDLFSERKISLRKQDLTIIAVESAAAGATIVGIIVTLILRHS